MIRITDLSFGYEELLFSNLHLKINTNQITLLSGANGSGKTTFCRILSGLEKGYSGQLTLEHQNYSELTVKDISQKIIYLKQEPMGNTVAATPNEDLAIWQGNLQRELTSKDQQQREKALADLHIEEFINTPFWELSGGQIKRSGLAALLLFPHRFWLLDEPASGLHPEMVEKLISILRQKRKNGSGALIISHKIDQFKNIADHILKIENKSIKDIK